MMSQDTKKSLTTLKGSKDGQQIYAGSVHDLVHAVLSVFTDVVEGVDYTRSGGPAELPGQLPNTQPGQTPGQLPNTQPGQTPGQLPNTQPGQTPGQLPNTQPGQTPGQLPNTQPGQTPGQLPNTQPGQTPGQLPNTQPGQTPGQLPNTQPGQGLDSEGLPWDARIHASTKTKYAKATGGKAAGSWKLLRGVAPELVEQVKMELTQLKSQEPSAQLAPDQGAITFSQLVDAVVMHGVSDLDVQAACAMYGLENLAAAQDSPGAVPVLYAKLIAPLQVQP